MTLKHFASTIALILLLAGQNLFAQTPNASLETLVTQLGGLKTQLADLTLTPDALCSRLAEADAAARSAADAVTAADESLAAPLQVDAATFDALDTLLRSGPDIANEAARLSTDLQLLQGAASVLTVKDGITAMLQLSDDIGTMADRIGEMADRILIMADNIGTMADRIVQTQEIQSQNLMTTTDTLLQTQQNVLTLVSVIETQSRTMDYTTLVSDGMDLYRRMQQVMLNPWMMKYQLREVAADVRTYLGSVNDVYALVNGDAASGTFYVDSTTIMQLYDLSVMLTFVATVVDGYVVAIEGLQSSTSNLTLKDAMKSMLQLSTDIGAMADRIGEMADVILTMSDNIGTVADEIVATQQFQSANLTAVQDSVLGVQEMVIAVTVAEGL